MVRPQGSLRTTLLKSQVRLIERLYAGCTSVNVSLLNQGYSGSIVLKVDSFGANGERQELSVLKLDKEQRIRDEVERTKFIYQQVGVGVIRVIREVRPHCAQSHAGGERCSQCPRFRPRCPQLTSCVCFVRVASRLLIAASLLSALSSPSPSTTKDGVW